MKPARNALDTAPDDAQIPAADTWTGPNWPPADGAPHPDRIEVRANPPLDATALSAGRERWEGVLGW